MMPYATGVTREMPYVRSQKFLNDTLRVACGDVSLARFERKLTWLGDVTFRKDDLPWLGNKSSAILPSFIFTP